jgi:hypothetical protein
MPTVVDTKVFPMCIADTTKFTLLFDKIVTVSCQIEISLFGKSIQVLFLDV